MYNVCEQEYLPPCIYLSLSLQYHDVQCVLCMCVKGYIRLSLCILHLSKNVEEDIIPIL